jgi:putative membrane protein
MHRYGDFGFGPMHGIGWIWMILFWLTVIALVVYLVKMAMRRGAFGKKDKSALDLLNERYARGEIDKDTYEQMKHDIIN